MSLGDYDDAIISIEGQLIFDAPEFGLVYGDSQDSQRLVTAKMRSNNADELMNRCREAWSNQGLMWLNFYNNIMQPVTMKILAIRKGTIEDHGDFLSITTDYDSLRLGHEE